MDPAPWSPGTRYKRLESNIGEGTYGKIHKALDAKTQEVVAIKKAKMSGADRATCGIGFTTIREIKLMQAVKHENVMNLMDCYNDGGILHLVMSFMDTDLRRIVDDRSIDLNEAHVKCLLRQLLSGIAACHQLFFVHRDVTPTNILLSYQSGVLKLTDFGSARTFGDDQKPLTPMCTTLWYRAPELLYGAKFYSQGVDIWSAGCIFTELFLRKALFPGRGELDMLGKVFEKRGTPTQEVWRDVAALPSFLEFSHHAKVPLATLVPKASESACSLMDAMLALDPKLRPSAPDVLQHAFCTSSSPPACEPINLPFVVRKAPDSSI